MTSNTPRTSQMQRMEAANNHAKRNWIFLNGRQFAQWKQLQSKDLTMFLQRNQDAVTMLLNNYIGIAADFAKLQDEHRNLQARFGNDTAKELAEENYQLQMKIIELTKHNERLDMICDENDKYKALYHALDRQLKEVTLQGACDSKTKFSALCYFCFGFYCTILGLFVYMFNIRMVVIILMH